MLPEKIRLIVVQNGRETPGVRLLDPGQTIAAREYDPDRDAYIIHLRTPGIPASPEVASSP